MNVSPLYEEIVLLREKTRVWVAVSDDRISTATWFGGSLYLQRYTQKLYFEHICLSIRRLTDRPQRKGDRDAMHSLYNALVKEGRQEQADALYNNADICAIRVLVDTSFAHPLEGKFADRIKSIPDIRPENTQYQAIFNAVALISSLFFDWIEPHSPRDATVQLDDSFLWSIRQDGIPFIDFPIGQIHQPSAGDGRRTGGRCNASRWRGEHR